MKINQIDDSQIENCLVKGEMVIKVNDDIDKKQIIDGIIDDDDNSIVILIEFIDVDHMNKLDDKNEGDMIVYGDNPIYVRMYSEIYSASQITPELIRYTTNRLSDLIEKINKDNEFDEDPTWYLLFDFSTTDQIIRKDLKEYSYTISNTLEAKDIKGLGTDTSGSLFNIMYLVKTNYDFDIFDIEHEHSKKKKDKKKEKKMRKKKNKKDNER
jgi:hypothetical protein